MFQCEKLDLFSLGGALFCILGELVGGVFLHSSPSKINVYLKSNRNKQDLKIMLFNGTRQCLIVLGGYIYIMTTVHYFYLKWIQMTKCYISVCIIHCFPPILQPSSV